jgi:hypothetical protein
MSLQKRKINFNFNTTKGLFKREIVIGEENEKKNQIGARELGKVMNKENDFFSY